MHEEFNAFDSISILLLADVAIWLALGWYGFKRATSPYLKVVCRAAAIALIFSPGVIVGHGIALAPALVGLATGFIGPNLASLVFVFVMSLVVVAYRTGAFDESND